jgi:hypothetical protein
MSETETLDGVLYKWACSTVVPLSGEPTNEYEMRTVRMMMSHGLKLLQVSQSPIVKLQSDLLDAIKANAELAKLNADMQDKVTEAHSLLQDMLISQHKIVRAIKKLEGE